MVRMAKRPAGLHARPLRQQLTTLGPQCILIRGAHYPRFRKASYGRLSCFLSVRPGAARGEITVVSACRRRAGPIRAKTAELAAAIERLARRVDPDLLLDVEVYHKAAEWIVRYADEEFFAKRYVADTLAALDHGLARAKELAAQQAVLAGDEGPTGAGLPLARGRQRAALCPVHSRPATTARSLCGWTSCCTAAATKQNEVSFIAGHDSGKPRPPEQDYIQLDVFGRGNNAYRWAGETDVFEALASVRQRYTHRSAAHRAARLLDGRGGGLAHRPALSRPLGGRRGRGRLHRHQALPEDRALPAYQEAPLHIYDAVRLRPNACDVPMVGYGGEDDAQFQATLNVRQRLVDEGFHFTPDGLNWTARISGVIFLVGPKTGHKFHPGSKQQSERIHPGRPGQAGTASRIASASSPRPPATTRASG